MRVFLSFGSNLGDKRTNIEATYEKVEERIGDIVAVSAFYLSTPVGFESDKLFVNSVCEVESDLCPHSILAITQEIEQEMGRNEKSTDGIYSDRVIDIDILLIEDLIIQSTELVIPHPRMHLRDFVLAPMCEIAPETVHPVFGKNVRELLYKQHHL